MEPSPTMLEPEEPGEPVAAPEPPAEPEPTEEPAEEPEAPDEPGDEPVAGITEKDAEQAFAKAEKEATRHANRLSEIFGESAQDFRPCPLCLPFAPGFVYPPDVAPVPDEIAAAVKVQLGEPPEPDYLKADDARVCDACAGLGRVLTGALVKDQRTKTCHHCKGYGWISLGGAAPVESYAPTDGQVDERPALPEDRPTDADPWGRLPGDPDYGRLPQYAHAS